MKRLLAMLVLMLLVSGCADTDLIVPVRNVAVHRCRNWYDLCYFDGSHVTDVLRDAVYLPVGYEIQCEYIDGRLVSGDGMTKWRPDYNYIENAIGAPG